MCRRRSSLYRGTLPSHDAKAVSSLRSVVPTAATSYRSLPTTPTPSHTYWSRMGPTWIHFVADHLLPCVVGQLPCRLLGSLLPSGLSE